MKSNKKTLYCWLHVRITDNKVKENDNTLNKGKKIQITCRTWLYCSDSPNPFAEDSTIWSWESYHTGWTIIFWDFHVLPLYHHVLLKVFQFYYACFELPMMTYPVLLNFLFYPSIMIVPYSRSFLKVGTFFRAIWNAKVLQNEFYTRRDKIYKFEMLLSQNGVEERTKIWGGESSMASLDILTSKVSLT